VPPNYHGGKSLVAKKLASAKDEDSQEDESVDSDAEDPPNHNPEARA